MTDKKQRRWLIAVLIIVLVVVMIQSRSGIHVTILNAGATPLRSVVIHVTGDSHSVGDIAPGGAIRVRVRPTSDSHLEIEFTDDDGQLKRLDAGGYFKSGYRGTIQVSIKEGMIDTNEHNIRHW